MLCVLDVCYCELISLCSAMFTFLVLLLVMFVYFLYLAWVQNIVSYLLFQEPNTSEGIGVGLTYHENVVWFEAQCTNSQVKEAILNSKNKKNSDDFVSDVIDITDSTSDNIEYINNLHMETGSEDNGKRRCFKSHSPLGILEPLVTAKGKIIHIARNPKDVAVSLWHHSCTKDFGYTGDFDHFLETMFSQGQVESGSWWDFVIAYWLASKRCEMTDKDPHLPKLSFSNVLTIWYEDLIQSPEDNIQKIVSFLEITDQISPGRIHEIALLCSFDAMKATQSSGGVVLKERTIAGSSECGSLNMLSSNQIRKGGVGGWVKYFSDAQCQSFDLLHSELVSRAFDMFNIYYSGDCRETNSHHEEENDSSGSGGHYRGGTACFATNAQAGEDVDELDSPACGGCEHSRKDYLQGEFNRAIGYKNQCTL
jgi:hypothetical protein